MNSIHRAPPRAAASSGDRGPPQARARHHHAAGRVGRGGRPARREPVRQQLSRPRRAPRARDGRAGGASGARIRPLVGPLHLRHAGRPQGPRGSPGAVPGVRGRDPLLLVLRRERRRLRGAPRRGGRRRLDALNHASIIDGIRLCKARRYRYANGDMADLDARLREADAAGARFKLVVTDGVFSMDGYLLAAGDLRHRRAPRRARHGGRQPRGRVHRRERARPSTSASWAGWTSSPARSGRRSAARRAATWRGLRGGGVATPEGAPVPVLERSPR